MEVLNDYQFDLLSQASNHLTRKDLAPYFKLRSLLSIRLHDFEPEFKRTFVHHYGMNAGGLTDEFKELFFKLLFDLNVHESLDPYTQNLRTLYKIPRRTKDNALHCSFVSKMVAIHDDSRPIFDRHVAKFFGISVPSIGSVDFRIAGFISNLHRIRSIYAAWSQDLRFQEVQRHLFKNIPDLQDSHHVRVCDALVWTVGRKKLAKA